ncbi:MAG: hypothetical protein IJK74_06645 [Bacteroidales bacterium]|nr:hypothetical protein [Bacteroidales bacterium]
MIEIINKNPFRILGVWSNSKQADIVRNVRKMKAYLNVGRNIEFPTDMQSILPAMSRTLESTQEAQADVNLPADKIHYALFWFCNASAIDGTGLNNLASGDSAKALSIFSMRETFSSLINRAVLSLILSDESSAISAYTTLIHNFTYREQFIAAICGDTFQMTEETLAHLLLDDLATTLGADKLMTLVYNNADKDYVTNKVVDGLLAKINSEIAKAKSASANNAAASLRAGKSLISNTRSTLVSLRNFVGSTDIRFQSASDNLAKQILQNGINYFNNSNDDNDIDNALELQKYALSIAVGKITKDRCQKNVDVLLNKKQRSAYEKDLVAIAKELKSFQASTNSISRARTLVNNCKPHLAIIKQHLGASDDFYLKISSIVANNALGMVIDVVNRTQNSAVLALNIANGTLSTTIDSAINAMAIIGTLDMTPQERSHFNANNTTLNGISIQLSRAMNQRKQSTSSSSGCYIATMVYGDYDHPQVVVLRHFRDNVLRNYSLGRLFIRFYYKHSPSWVEYLKDKKCVNSFIRKILDKFISIYKHEKN